MNSITILAEKVKAGRWDVLADAFYRLNMATPVEIEPDTLQAALRDAGVKDPKDLPKLTEVVGENKYLCMSFEASDEGQKITFSGVNEPIKVKAPTPQ